MAIIAKLHDVEQQLARVTQVIHLHVNISEASLSDESIDGTPSTELSAAIDRVEREKNELERATTQFLSLARCCLQKHLTIEEANIDDDTETEDEFENATQEKDLQTEEQKGNVHCILSSNESYQKYVSVTTEARQKGLQRKGDIQDASDVVIYMNKVEIMRVTALTTQYALEASKLFLDALRDEVVAEGTALTFAETTEFAVAVLVSRPSRAPQRQWLVDFARSLREIIDAGSKARLDQMLLAVERSYDDLERYFSNTYRSTLEDASSYLELIKRRGETDTAQLRSFSEMLLQKFMTDCTECGRNQLAFRKWFRTESDWALFSEIGVTLTNWLNALWGTDTPWKKGYLQIINDKLRAFDSLFPGRIPRELLKYWGCAANTTDEERESATHDGFIHIPTKRDEIVSKPNALTVLLRSHTISKRNRKKRKKRPSSTGEIAEPERKRYATSTGTKPGTADTTHEHNLTAEKENEAVINSTTNCSHPNALVKTSAISIFLEAAKIAKRSLTNMAQEQATSAISGDSELLVVGKWDAAIREHFGCAITAFCAAILNCAVDDCLVEAFSDATMLAVSLITTRESSSFKRGWVAKLAIHLDELRMFAINSPYAAKLLPTVLESRNALLRYHEKHFPDCFRGMSTYVRNIEQVETQGVTIKRLQSFIVKVVGMVLNAIKYCVLTCEVSGIMPPTDEQWQSFSDTCQTILYWVSIALQAPNPPSFNLTLMRAALVEFETKFPGRTPSSLFALCNGTETKVLVESINAPTSIPTNIKLIQASDNSAECINELRVHMNTYLDMAAHCRKRFNDDEPIAEMARLARKLFSLTLDSVCALLQRIRHDIIVPKDVAIMFGEAIGITTELMDRCSWECMDYSMMKPLMNHSACALRISKDTEKLSHLIPYLVASEQALQKYWDKYYANPWLAMQTLLDTMGKPDTCAYFDPMTLEAPARALICRLRVACGYVLYQDRKKLRPALPDVQENLNKAGLVLNAFLEHIMDHAVTLVGQLVHGGIFSIFLKSLMRLEIRFPESVPVSLIGTMNRILLAARNSGAAKDASVDRGSNLAVDNSTEPLPI